MMQKIVTFVAIFGVGGALLASSVRGQTAAAAAALQPVTVYIVQRHRFEPPTWGFDRETITIPPGITVTWKSVPGNSDGHTSTSNDDVWNSHVLNPGDTWSFTFSKAGSYRYHCALHPWMVGVVKVVAGAPVPPPISAPPSN